jgi:hypothetical protein
MLLRSRKGIEAEERCDGYMHELARVRLVTNAKYVSVHSIIILKHTRPGFNIQRSTLSVQSE